MKTVKYITPITPGSYTNPTIAVDAQGLITSASGAAAAAQCIVTRAAVASFAAGDDIIWTTVSYDPLSMFNGTTTITIPSAGNYLVTYSLTFSDILAAVVDVRDAGVYFAGEQYGIPRVGTAQQSLNMTFAYNFVGGETLTVRNTTGAHDTSVVPCQFAVAQLP